MQEGTRHVTVLAVVMRHHIGPLPVVVVVVLTWANLTNANFSSANLTNADLSGAYLNWANLTNADLLWRLPHWR